MSLPIFGFGKGFGIGIGSRFGQQQKKQLLANKKPSGPRRAGPGYITGRGQARGTAK